MKFTRAPYILSVLWVVLLGLGTPAISEEPPKGNPAPASPGDRLHQLKESLLEAHKNSGLNSEDFPIFYVEAKSRIRAAQEYLEANPKAKNMPGVIEACSLLVNAGKLQIEIEVNQQKMADLHKQKDSVLRKLNQTYQDINHLERNYSSTLKQDLSETRKKALEEQEKSRRLQAEMEAKFKDLESDVISVRKDARGTILSMSDILFDTGKSNLKADLKTNLAKIAGILTVYKNSAILVEGHTDNVGTAEYNMKLSEERALNVCNFLIDQGIGSERMSYKGYGLTAPVADNSTKQGRAQNRRVDIIVNDKAKKKESE